MSENVDLEKLQTFMPFDCLTESHLAEIRGQIKVYKLPPAKVIFKRGSSSSRAYFLISGAVDLTDASFQVRHFPADDDENYLALDNYATHTVNAITTEPTILYGVDREHLDLLMTWTQAAESMLDEEEDDTETPDWMDALLGSELFSQVPPAKIQSLFVKFQEREVELGEKIITQGETGDSFYVIKRGKAMVTREEAGKTQTLAALSSGSFFGEDALISETERNATVTMTSDGVLMCLDKEDFREILQASVIKRVTDEEMRDMMDEGDRACVLLDVRLPMEVKHDRKVGAKNVPLTELRRELKNLEKDFIYVVSCDGGGRSELGCYLLTEAGFEAYVLDQPSPKETAADASDEQPDASAEQEEAPDQA
jgi:CRP-like cAMP-binding protein